MSIPSLSNQRGITLIEIMVVVAISSIILTSLLRFMAVGFPVSKATYLQARSTEDARLQLKRIGKALREVRPSDTGAYPLVDMSPQRLIFYANVDGDLATERVRYELNGTNLERGIINPTGNPLVYDVAQEQVIITSRAIRNSTEALFTYYGGNYPADTTPLTPVDLTEVKYIQFHLIIDIDPNVDPAAVDVVSQAQLRNLKTNLGETVE
ncbi:MAG: type II secretion system protein [Candidatus Andersenbacteria bacterium]